MARFTQPVAPTQDPNYMSVNQSRALPSWEAQSATDRSTAGLIDNISKLGAAAAHGADTAVQTDIRDNLYKDIDATRDQSTNSALQGAAASVQPQTPGTNSDTNPDGPPDVFSSTNGVPPDAAAAIAGAGRMRQATLNGQLADSHYYMNLEAIASKYRARYPGYREQIDNMISQITGVDPANALRKNAIQLLETTQKLASDNQTKMFNVYHTDQAYFEATHPGMTFEDFMKNPYGYMAEAGNLKANKLKMESDKMALDLANTQDQSSVVGAQRLFTNETNLYVSTFMTGALNKLKEQGINLANQGANANPTEVAQFMAQANALKTQIGAQIDALATRPLRDGSSNSYSSIINDPSKIASIKKQAIDPIDTIITAVGGKDYNVANAAATITKMQTDQTWQKLTANVPQAEIYGALRHGIGDQTTGQLLAMSNGAGLTELTKAITDTNWLRIANPNATTPPPSATEIIKGIGETNPVNPGRVNKMTVQGIIQLAQHDDPKIAARAVQSLYGDPLFFANIKDSEKAQVYNTLTSPAFTQKMIALRKSDPTTFDKYVNFAQQNGIVVAKQGIDDLQSAAEYNRYNVTFDPKTMQFTAQTKPEFAPRNISGHPIPDNAQTYVSKINQLGTTLAPILREKYGDQAPQQFMRVLEANGYNPNAPQNSGWIDTLGKAVSGAVGAVDDYLNKGNRTLAPGESPTNPAMSRPRGRQSSIEMDDTPPPAGDIHGERHQYAYQYFIDKGYTPIQAAGIVGGLSGETAHIDPTQVHDGGIGLGIAGWNRDRLANLRSFAKQNKMPVTDLQTQLAFVDHELKTSESGAYEALKNAKTPEEAGQAMLLYERPTDYNVPGAHPERAKFAARTYAQYASNAFGDTDTIAGPKPPAQWAKDGTVNSPEEDKQLDDYQKAVTLQESSKYEADKKGRLKVPENWKAPDGFRGTVILPSGIQMSYPGVMRRRTYK